MEERFLEELNRRRPTSMAAVEEIWYNGRSRRGQHYDQSRYHCLNLHSVFQKGTVEFRLFNGTLMREDQGVYPVLPCSYGTGVKPDLCEQDPDGNNK